MEAKIRFFLHWAWKVFTVVAIYIAMIAGLIAAAYYFSLIPKTIPQLIISIARFGSFLIFPIVAMMSVFSLNVIFSGKAGLSILD